MNQSNNLNKLHEFSPFLWSCLDAPFDGLKISKIIENILNFFSTILAENHKDAIIKFNYTFLVDDSWRIGQVLQPFVWKHHLMVPEIMIFHIEVVIHFPQFLLRVVVKGVLRASNPA
jgi:hypothetical protein